MRCNNAHHKVERVTHSWCKIKRLRVRATRPIRAFLAPWQPGIALSTLRTRGAVHNGVKQLHEQLCSVHWTGAQLERAQLGEHSPSVPGACGNAGQLCIFAQRPPPLPLHRTISALSPSACARVLLRVEVESSCSLAGAIAKRLTNDSQTAADPQRGSGGSRGVTDC